MSSTSLQQQLTDLQEAFEAGRSGKQRSEAVEQQLRAFKVSGQRRDAY